MTKFSELYAPHHKLCDEVFAEAEAAAAESRWEEATSSTQRLARLVESHLASEEGTLFPAFEAQAGRGGPTEVMRAEHEQMRWMLSALVQAAQAREAEAYSGAAETLLILMQQHNMKEENILYPMCDRVITDAGLAQTILAQLAR